MSWGLAPTGWCGFDGEGLRRLQSVCYLLRNSVPGLMAAQPHELPCVSRFSVFLLFSCGPFAVPIQLWATVTQLLWARCDHPSGTQGWLGTWHSFFLTNQRHSSSVHFLQASCFRVSQWFGIHVLPAWLAWSFMILFPPEEAMWKGPFHGNRV